MNIIYAVGSGGTTVWECPVSSVVSVPVQYFILFSLAIFTFVSVVIRFLATRFMLFIIDILRINLNVCEVKFVVYTERSVAFSSLIILILLYNNREFLTVSTFYIYFVFFPVQIFICGVLMWCILFIFIDSYDLVFWAVNVYFAFVVNVMSIFEFCGPSA